ncbi:hypothetical protein FCT18_15630 [Lysinibacillus sphaericus]|nr:hypothetical protein [Lysinibacillus sphaericus]AVK96225.1 hypothetical protein LS41612_08150 [Lysinibacillus sphaericus]MED4544488.1 hypothetical protein [Lysinibacillus sphaericus]TKI18097.1 hypothetical protein FCT18_15630 [Lysinibacillus sphaericus]GEC82926.1 hypothetical protein LSP03_26690 [Lysinibacillus sphaericus]
MLKRAVQLTSLICVMMLSLLIFQYTSLVQQRLPLGTTNQFDLNLAETTIAKDQLVSDLNRLTDQYNAIVVKTSVDPENYDNKKDILYFGTAIPAFHGLLIEHNAIKWFESALTGELLSTADIGTRSLSGTYAFNAGKDFQEALKHWAQQHQIRILFVQEPSLLTIVYAYLFQNGIGNALLASLLLLVTTIITWIFQHAKARSIRLLGGVKAGKIHVEDTTTILSFIFVGFLLGLFISLCYVGVVKDIRQIPFVLNPLLLCLMLFLIVVGIITALLSLTASPKAAHIAKRQIPLKRFFVMGKLSQVLVMILSLIVIPTIITSLLITNQLSKEYALWDKMHNIVRLSMFDLDSLEQESTLPEVEAFFSKMQEANNLSLSLVINKAIFLESHQMGGYDHIIITDRAWIDLLEIGVETEGKGGKLIAKNDKDLPDELASFLEGQIPLWTKHNDVYPAQGLTFYEYKGMKFLALPPNVGLAGETVQAENPLVILIDGHLTDIVKTKGFLISLASSGNIVFFDEDHLQAALANSVMKSSITSINGIADVALETAQRFKQQYVYYIVAGLLIFVTMLLTAVLNGRLWAGTNGKRIFTLHTFGYPYTSIIGPVLKRQLFIIILTTIVGSVIGYFIHYVQLSVLLPSALIVGCFYLIGSTISFKNSAKQAFYRTSHRYN